MARESLVAFETFLKGNNEPAAVQSAFEGLCTSLEDAELETDDLLFLQRLAMEGAPGIDSAQWQNLCAEQTRRLKSEVKSNPRRNQQDYTTFPNFLTKREWQNMYNAVSGREAAIELSGFLHGRLRLRLPTEPTFAQMVAVVAAAQRIGQSQFDLRALLQTVKKAWRSTAKRHKADTSEELLLQLPATWEQLPQEIQDAFEDSLPLSPMKQPFRNAEIRAIAAKVVLRGNKGTPDADNLAAIRDLMQLVRKEEEDDNLLKNLEIYRPKQRAAGQLPLDWLPNEPQKALADTTVAATLQKKRSILSIADDSQDMLLTPQRASGQPAPAAEPPAEEAASVLEGVAEALKAERAARKKEANAQKKAEKAKKEAPSPQMKRPAAAKSAQRKRTASGAELPNKKQKPANAPAEDVPEEKPHNCRFHCAFWGDCKFETYSAKSYIRFLCNESKTWKMIIGCTDARRHATVTWNLIRHVKAGKTKEQLTTVRDELLR